MRYPVIDPTALGPMEVIEALDVEAIITARMARVVEEWTNQDPATAALYDVDALETDPIKIVERANAYLELMLRDRINAAARDTTLAYATGNNLDAIASRYPGGVPRVASEVYTDDDSPIDKAAKDARYRYRIWLSPNAMSPHGVSEAYIFWALTAHPELRDVTATVSRVNVEHEPRIIVTCLNDTGPFPTPAQQLPAGAVPVWSAAATYDPRPDRATLLDVLAYLSDEGRKGETDILSVVAARLIDVVYDADLWLYPTADQGTVMAAVSAAMATMIEDRRLLGMDHTLAGFYGALNQAGVHHAVVNSPTSDVFVDATQFARTVSITLRMRGRAE